MELSSNLYIKKKKKNSNISEFFVKMFTSYVNLTVVNKIRVIRKVTKYFINLMILNFDEIGKKFWKYPIIMTNFIYSYLVSWPYQSPVFFVSDPVVISIFIINIYTFSRSFLHAEQDHVHQRRYSRIIVLLRRSNNYFYYFFFYYSIYAYENLHYGAVVWWSHVIELQRS
jgi:hypothetical protein